MAWLSHTENPSSSTRVGTVCCGLIYGTNTRNRMRRVLIIHLEEFRFEMLARHQVYLSLDQVEPQSISCDQDGSNRRTRYDHVQNRRHLKKRCARVNRPKQTSRVFYWNELAPRATPLVSTCIRLEAKERFS
jgi:hypothetical protein